ILSAHRLNVGILKYKPISLSCSDDLIEHSEFFFTRSILVRENEEFEFSTRLIIAVLVEEPHLPNTGKIRCELFERDLIPVVCAVRVSLCLIHCSYVVLSPLGPLFSSPRGLRLVTRRREDLSRTCHLPF